MRILLARIGLLIGSAVILVHWPVPFLFLVWGLAIWLVPRAYRNRREITQLRAKDPAKDAYVAELRSELQIANAHIEYLQQQLEEASRASRPQSRTSHPLYRRVGLDQDCPRWVAEVVRREYRKRLHPDGQPVGKKAEAEKRFVKMEEVFGEIWRGRGF